MNDVGQGTNLIIINSSSQSYKKEYVTLTIATLAPHAVQVRVSPEFEP
jgi:hypothetical protein